MLGNAEIYVSSSGIVRKDPDQKISRAKKRENSRLAASIRASIHEPEWHEQYPAGSWALYKGALYYFHADDKTGCPTISVGQRNIRGFEYYFDGCGALIRADLEEGWYKKDEIPFYVDEDGNVTMAGREQYPGDEFCHWSD